MKSIAYQAGYKYQLRGAYLCLVPIRPDRQIDTEFISLNPDGLLTVQNGYAWDGPSGPTFDTPSFMRGSLVHDALYQLMREDRLDHAHRDAADQLLAAMCREDGMGRLRAWWVYRSLRRFGGPAARPSGTRPILYAP